MAHSFDYDDVVVVVVVVLQDVIVGVGCRLATGSITDCGLSAGRWEFRVRLVAGALGFTNGAWSFI